MVVVVAVVVVVVVVSSVLVALVVAGSPLLAVVSPAAGVHPITSAAAAAATVRALEVDGMAKLVGRLRMAAGSLARAGLSPLVRPHDDHSQLDSQRRRRCSGDLPPETMSKPHAGPLAVVLALCWGPACGDSVQVDSEGSSGGATATTSGSTGPATSTTPTTSGEPVTTGGTTSDGGTTGDPTTTDPATSSTGDESSTGEPPDPAAPLFEPGAIAEFALDLSAEAIDSLDADPKIYVLGDLTVTVGGQVTVLTDIGVRLKGNYGSFRTLDEKAAFLFNFDRYIDDQRLFDLEKLAVNNMVQDPSMQRELLGYTLFRAGDVPAPRAGHATVSVNGELYGLYTTIETVDNEEFLKTWFSDDKGALYEGAYGSDLFTDLVPSFDQDNGDNVDFMDLQALVQQLDAIVDPADFVTEVDKLIDLDRFLTFAATEIYLGHWDGYAWTRNNFFVYRGPDQRWVLLPWGIDQTMVDNLGPFGGEGRLQQMCVQSLECRMLLAEKFQAVVARVDELGLAAQAQTLADALRDAADADPRKEYGIDSVDGNVAANIEFLTNRGLQVMDDLICTDPSKLDADNDGYSGCGEDCDDGDKTIHPGAAEICDLDDDNCDGQWDNDPKCPQCIVKKLPAPALGSAALCFGARTWAEAEADCVVQKGHLIAVHTQAVQDFLEGEAFAIQDTDWWLGLSDSKNEGSFVWSNASKLDFTSWAGGEPNNSGNEDCVHLAPWADGDWNDMFCDQVRPYICAVP